MRLFIAIEIPEDLKKRIAGIEGIFSDPDFGIKLVEPGNLHITLKFLGEVSEAGMGFVDRYLSEFVSGQNTFNIAMEGLGFFRNPDFISVIWIGLKEGRERVIALMREMNKGLEHIRKEEFRPEAHLTIGRVNRLRDREKLLKLLEQNKAVKIGEVEVKEICLKKSILTGNGPVYSDVKRYPLRQ